MARIHAFAHDAKQHLETNCTTSWKGNSMAVFAPASQAIIDLHIASRRAQRALSDGILRDGLWYRVSLEQAQEMYREDAQKILRDALVEVNPDSPLVIQCGGCKKIDCVARDVKTFRCYCSPNREQWVCKSHYLDLS